MSDRTRSAAEYNRNRSLMIVRKHRECLPGRISPNGARNVLKFDFVYVLFMFVRMFSYCICHSFKISSMTDGIDYFHSCILTTGKWSTLLSTGSLNELIIYDTIRHHTSAPKSPSKNHRIYKISATEMASSSSMYL